MTARPTSAQARLAAFKPKPATETVGHLHMAGYLHAAFPGSNPRPVRKVKGVTVEWEPAHPWLQWWHTPNQGQRSLREGAEFRRMGMRAGVSDIQLLVRLAPSDTHLPVPIALPGFIEVKRDGVKSSKLTPGQERFRDDMRAMGAWWAECRSVAELDATLHQWLDPWGLTWRTPPTFLLPPVVKRGSV